MDAPINLRVASSTTPGHILLVIQNVPIEEFTNEQGEIELVPCVKMTTRQAIEYALSIIWVAKTVEQAG